MADTEFREQSPLPHLKPVEKGRRLEPRSDEPVVEFDVFTNEWTHLCSARFGPGRPCSFSRTTLWTGDSYRYDIFVPNDESKELIALRWWNGSGEGWLVGEDRNRRDELSVLRIFAEIPTETKRWDACHQLWKAVTYAGYAAANSEAKKYATAFAEGRLKKRRRKGQVRVEIVPKIVTVAR